MRSLRFGVSAGEAVGSAALGGADVTASFLRETKFGRMAKVVLASSLRHTSQLKSN